MGFWSFYFLAKIGLYWVNLIGFNVWSNLLFALALCIPVPPSLERFKPWRTAVAVVVAVALLWYDTGLPPPSRVVQQWSELAQFSHSYWIELLDRVWSWQVAGALVLGAAVYALLVRRVRLGVVAIVLMALLSWLPWPKAAPTGELQGEPASAGDVSSSGVVPAPVAMAASANSPVLDKAQLDQALATFYETERHRNVRFPQAQGGVPPFDLLIISICSLSWDDLMEAGMANAPLLRRMDLLFRQFNSAASYSGPAVLRLLHGTCGQTPQGDLYTPASADCYVFQQLRQMGYRNSLLMNHDGRYDGFGDQLQKQGGIDAKPADHRSAPVAMYGFDGSPIYDDFEVLSRWWRSATDADPAGTRRYALLYNTISLHDGNRRKGEAAGNSLQTWPSRARALFSDIESMLALVENSGRPTVVVLVPEHGAALRGDRMQIPGLRELPTPRITHVPAGVALLNFGPRPADAAPVVVDQVSSYNSLMAVVGALMQQPSAPWTTLKQVGDALPAEGWVAENDGTIVMSEGGRLYTRTRDGSWSH